MADAVVAVVADFERQWELVSDFIVNIISQPNLHIILILPPPYNSFIINRERQARLPVQLSPLLNNSNFSPPSPHELLYLKTLPLPSTIII